MNIGWGKTIMDKQTRIFFPVKIVVLAVAVACLLVGCSSHKKITLMPTPVIYQDLGIDPFAHLTLAHQSTKTQIFYATNRIPKSSENKIVYGNSLDSTLHLGKATILMGDPDFYMG